MASGDVLPQRSRHCLGVRTEICAQSHKGWLRRPDLTGKGDDRLRRPKEIFGAYSARCDDKIKKLVDKLAAGVPDGLSGIALEDVYATTKRGRSGQGS